jgi:hypothetical protein
MKHGHIHGHETQHGHVDNDNNFGGKKKEDII